MLRINAISNRREKANSHGSEAQRKIESLAMRKDLKIEMNGFERVGVAKRGERYGHVIERGVRLMETCGWPARWRLVKFDANNSFDTDHLLCDKFH